MTDTVPPDSVDVRALKLRGETSQRAFRTLLDSSARPGVFGHVGDLLPAGVPSSLLVPLALADVEVSVAVLGPEAGRWEQLVADATGARIVPLADAQCVVALDGLGRDDVLALRRGTALRPEEGARLAVGVDTIVDSAAHRSGGVEIELRGPGVAGSSVIHIAGIDVGLIEALGTANAGFPAGVDTWFFDTAGRVVAVPRSSTIAVRDLHEGE